MPNLDECTYKLDAAMQIVPPVNYTLLITKFRGITKFANTYDMDGICRQRCK